jgi:tetratricopeptide (TPR) repeat protein
MTPQVRFRGLAASGAIATRLGNLDLAQERKEAALALARELDDELGIAKELSDLGTVAAMREEYDVASEMFEESAALFRKLDIPSRLGTVLSNLGHIAGQRGDYELAIRYTEEALELESSHKQNAAISSYNLGIHNFQAGHLDEARAGLERTVALTLELGFKEVMAYALAAYARLCLFENDAERAAYLAGISDRLQQDAGLQLQPSELAPFEEAKATLEQQLGNEFAAIHDNAMAAPLEESLRQGGVLAQVPASP